MLGVSTSGYYAWRRRPHSRRAQANRALSREIAQIHEQSRGTLWSIYEVSDYLGCGSYGSRVVPEVDRLGPRLERDPCGLNRSGRRLPKPVEKYLFGQPLEQIPGQEAGLQRPHHGKVVVAPARGVFQGTLWIRPANDLAGMRAAIEVIRDGVGGDLAEPVRVVDTTGGERRYHSGRISDEQDPVPVEVSQQAADRNESTALF